MRSQDQCAIPARQIKRTSKLNARECYMNFGRECSTVSVKRVAFKVSNYPPT